MLFIGFLGSKFCTNYSKRDELVSVRLLNASEIMAILCIAKPIKTL